MFYEAVGFLVLVSVIISLVRLLKGPTAYDRMIAIDSIASLVMILIVLVSFISDNMMLIDIAILYAILNFTGTLAVSKYFLKERMWKG